MALNGRERIPEELVTEEDLREAGILVVDHTEVRATMLERALTSSGYRQVFRLSDPWEVVDAVSIREPAVVLLALDMPELDGFSVLQLMTKEIPPAAQVPVILVGDAVSDGDRRRGLEAGAFDFLSRPLDNPELLLCTRNALRTTLLKRQALTGRLDLEEQLRIHTSELDDAQIEILERLAMAAEYVDDQTGDHALRVGMISGMIARELGLNPSVTDMIRRAAPLHDVGKIGIPEQILSKPGPLTDEEMTVMKTHTTIGAKIVFGSHPTLWLAGEICMNHHERWDGTGYPSGKSGEEIPVVGRIVAVADVYDTLCGSRSYHNPWPHDEAFEEIKRQRGKQFDSRSVDAFLRLPHPLFVEVARVVGLRN